MTAKGKEDCDTDHAPAHKTTPLPENVKPDQLREETREAEDRQEALIDEAVEETFPASDPATPKHIT